MATQKVTFSLPKDLVTQFVRRVPARHRSRYVAEALTIKLRERDQVLARACDVVNGNRKQRALEREWDTLTDEIEERWNGAAKR
jgi:hypothetical protein